MSDSRISVPFRHGPLEISGSEDFVQKQLEKFDDYIKGALDGASKAPAIKSKDVNEIGGRRSSLDESNDLDASAFFEIHEDRVHVLEVPGNSNKEKTVNAALLYLFASRTIGNEEVGYDSVREVCKNHGFLDNTNFSKYLKSEKSLFVFSGSGRNQTIKLSKPGQKKAADLISGAQE